MRLAGARSDGVQNVVCVGRVTSKGATLARNRTRSHVWTLDQVGPRPSSGVGECLLASCRKARLRYGIGRSLSAASEEEAREEAELEAMEAEDRRGCGRRRGRLGLDFPRPAARRSVFASARCAASLRRARYV
eukprot:scaffold3418_cov124-Isochrysis_galbana.AAC.15